MVSQFISGRKAKNRAAPQLLKNTETVNHGSGNKGQSGLEKGKDSMLDSAI